MGSWKLIRFYEDDREELYNLVTDPSEQNDLAAAQPGRRHKLSVRLDQWLHKVDAQMPLPR